MRFRGAIFDLDGTLLDSMGMWDDIDVAFLSRRGLTVPDDYVQAIVPLSFRETAVYTIDRFGLMETPEAVMETWMNSAGHRGNILNGQFTDIGVGYYENGSGVGYWVQVFTY